MDESFKQEFLINAISGASKSQIVRLYEDEMGCSSEDIKELLALPELQKRPNFINYLKFNNIKIPNTAKCFKFPLTKIYIQKNFLSKENCEIMIKETEKTLEPAYVANVGDRRVVSEQRTSSTTAFNYRLTGVGTDLDLEICSYLNFNPFCSEWCQGQKYAPGEFYKEHHDFFHPFTEEYKTYIEWMGQRTWTFMLYLNDVEEGGETYFKHLNLKIKPERGKAIFWNNLYPIGWPNIKTMHEALPPISGNKYIVTKWFRSWPLFK